MDANNPNRALVTVREAARHHGIYPRHLWRSIRAGSLPAYQIGGWLRVRLSDVDKWIEGMRAEGGGPRLLGRTSDSDEAGT